VSSTGAASETGAIFQEEYTDSKRHEINFVVKNTIVRRSAK
jgi:hypothetical protein